MADQDRPSGVSPAGASRQFEHDLRDIREARGVSLEDVQQQTRIPVDILRRFEAGDLIGDPHYNEVYLRALLKSYAQALHVSPQEATKAYEAARQNGYDGALRRQYLGGSAPAPTPERDPAVKAGPPQNQRERRAAERPPPDSHGAAPAVAALSQAPASKPASEVPAADRPNEHFPKRRVQTAAEATATGKPLESAWGLVIGGALVGVLVIAGVLWLLFRDDAPEPERAARPVAADTARAGEREGGEVEQAATPTDIPPAPQLSTPIRVTVIAQGGALEGFRVTEAPDIRRPYWLEQGNEQTFESAEEVVIWGTGVEGNFGIPAEMRLRMQGIEWDPADGQVLRINPQRGQALLDSLHRAQYQGGAG